MLRSVAAAPEARAEAATDTGYSARHMAGQSFTASGLPFSPDSRTMYWSNTPEHRIDRFDFDVATGEITNRRPWVQFDRKVEGQPYGGRPDGAAVDVQGNYWVAMYEGACVLQLSPTSEVLQRIAVPVQCPTMVCFGGGGFADVVYYVGKGGEAGGGAGGCGSGRFAVQHRGGGGGAVREFFRG